MQGVLESILQLLATFGGGLYIALSPCLFPLLPLFLMRTLRSEDSRKRSVLISLVLVLGILTSLAVFSLISGFIGIFILQHFTQLQAILGFFLIFFGIVTASERVRKALHLGSMSLSNQPETPTGLLGVYTVGLGYSLLAAPCVGPTLFALFFTFSTQTDLAILLLMFFVLCVAVAIPYLALALVSGEARTRMAMRMTDSVHQIELIIGIIFIILGIVLILPFFGVPRFF